jgi:hypothetical protein
MVQLVTLASDIGASLHLFMGAFNHELADRCSRLSLFVTHIDLRLDVSETISRGMYRYWRRAYFLRVRLENTIARFNEFMGGRTTPFSRFNLNSFDGCFYNISLHEENFLVEVPYMFPAILFYIIYSYLSDKS